MANERENSEQLCGLLHECKRKETPSLSGSVWAESESRGLIHPSLVTVALFLLVYLSVGAVCFYTFKSKIEGKDPNGVIDILYYCVVTMTTVGYGDLVPDAPLTKLLACAFVFAGMALVALVLSKAADFLAEKQETLLFRALHAPPQAGLARLRYKCLIMALLLSLLMALGTAVLNFVEGKDLLDAFYCVCCTITTLGYGDQSFSTTGGRAFAVFWILTTTVCLGQFFLYVAELSTETRRRKLAKRVLARRLTYKDLNAADINRDGVVEPAEFIVFKLKEMGKISEEDIAMVMEEFDELDVDGSRTISVSDIQLPQSGVRTVGGRDAHKVNFSTVHECG